MGTRYDDRDFEGGHRRDRDSEGAQHCDQNSGEEQHRDQNSNGKPLRDRALEGERDGGLRFDADRDLEGLFKERQAADLPALPDFSRVWSAALDRQARSAHVARRRVPWGLATAVSAGLALVLAVFQVGPCTQQKNPLELQVDTQYLEWQSPTAFLLEYPGHDYLGSVPQFGETDASWSNTSDAQSEQ